MHNFYYIIRINKIKKRPYIKVFFIYKIKIYNYAAVAGNTTIKVFEP